MDRLARSGGRDALPEGLADVVKLTFFLTDVRYRPDLVPIREEFFGPKLPASTLITTPALAHPDYLIEIEAVAFVEGR